MNYVLVKHLHITLVVLSVAGFALRWAGRLAQAAWSSGRAARTLPHVLDSALLLSGVVLAATWGAALGPWFVAKMLGLLAYIVLGALSLRASLARPLRVAAGLGALAVVGWMVSVATSKQPWGFLAGA